MSKGHGKFRSCWFLSLLSWLIAVQARPNQFGFLLATVLFFGNGSSLFAGMVFPLVSIHPSMSASFHMEVPSPANVAATAWVNVGDDDNSSAAFNFAANHIEVPDTAALLFPDSSPRVEEHAPRAVGSNSLQVDPRRVQAPPPPAAPPGGDKVGGRGTDSLPVSRDQQVAWHAWSASQNQESIATPSFQTSQSIPDSSSDGLFRPPRGC
jgi:hypothetical protein